MRPGAVGQRRPPRDQGKRRLLGAVLVSLLVHGLILSLQFGIPALGLPGSATPIEVRLIDAAVAPAPVPPPAPVVAVAPLPLPAGATPPAPAGGMRLLDPVPAPAPVPVPVTPRLAVKKDQPRKAKRISAPLPASDALAMDTRVIAQDVVVNDFSVPMPRPEEAQQKTIDLKEAQHGSDDGTEATSAAEVAEAARAAQLAETRRQEQEAERLAAQRKRDEEEKERKLTELQARRQQEKAAAEASQEQEKQARLAQAEAEAALKVEQQKAEQVAAQQKQALQQADQLRAEQARAERLKADQQQLAQKLAEQQAAQKLAVQQAAQKLAEQQAAQKLVEQAATQKLAEQQAAQKLVEQAAAQKLAEQQATQKLAEQQAAQKLAAQQAAQKLAEQAAQKQAEQAAQKQAAQAAAAAQAAQQAALQRGREGSGSQGVNTPPGGTAAGAGSGAGGKIIVPKNLLGSDLSNRAREMVKGLDILSGTPPAPMRDERRVAVGAAERDLPLRMYVESWRQKIERNGSVNYPRSWADVEHTDALVNVAVRSDGTVQDVTILRSSGRADMDEAVQRIVRVNARYSPFPPNIASRYDVIDIRRVWRFDESLKLMEELR
ncbi:cell envelope integrity protein TolA [Massilia antarctica]|uniref:Cell envelope integrity protein TolA n=1 Tax=Massilia antarctica TaxID=2765360 RepID=A0AA49A6W7_9BURK|nr:cell envelope integrity protein TolA [Massilia antarctica]QPI47930.1 cell envelope integrity protein TolA [Massilia antarctica]